MAAATAPPVDMELKKAFQKLQEKAISTKQQMKVADAQEESLKRQIQYSRLVEQEVSALPPSTKTYEGVGRMFILQPMDHVKKTLADKITDSETKIKNIENQKKLLEKSIKEAEDELRELIVLKQRST